MPMDNVPMGQFSWCQPPQATCGDATFGIPVQAQVSDNPSSRQAQATSPAKSYLLQHILFQFYIYGISQDDMDEVQLMAQLHNPIFDDNSLPPLRNLNQII
nr:hypothetical protein CFP56_55148 [Quercus suber]